MPEDSRVLITTGPVSEEMTVAGLPWYVELATRVLVTTRAPEVLRSCSEGYARTHA
jgi:hypothetical protein